MSKTSNHAKLEALKGWLTTLKPRPKKVYQPQPWEINENEYTEPTRYTRVISKYSR